MTGEPTPPGPGQGAAPPTGDATGGVVPYKNPQALTAYYCAVFSLIPCLALILGPVALALGVRGYRAYRRTPIARGHVHAWIGIILGSLTFVLNAAVVIAVLLSR